MITFDKLNKWLKDNDIQYNDFAERIGVSYDTLLAVLNRKTSFRLDVLNRICEVTDLSVEQVLSWYPDDTYDMAKDYKQSDISYKKLFNLIKEKGFSGYALSKAIGRSANYISNIKRERAKIGIDTIKQIADLLQVKPSDLFEIKGE